MTEMTVAEKLFALRSSPGFERLHDSELAVIAAAAAERRFGPGDLVCRGGTTLSRVYVIVRGSIVTSGGKAIPGILGLGSVLFDVPVRETLNASPIEGAWCLVISKPHAFTIAYQCPSFLCGLIDVRDLSE
jgi:hypothetical protein